MTTQITSLVNRQNVEKLLNNGLNKKLALQYFIKYYVSEMTMSEDVDEVIYLQHLKDLVNDYKSNYIKLQSLKICSSIAYRKSRNNQLAPSLSQTFNMMNEGNTAQESIDLYFQMKYRVDFAYLARKYQTEESEETVKFLLKTKLERYIQKYPGKILVSGFFARSLENMLIQFKRQVTRQRGKMVFVENEKLNEYPETTYWQQNANQEKDLKVEAGLKVLEELMESDKHKYRFQFLMDFTGGMSYLEIAEKYNVPKGTVMSGLSRARATLTQRINELEEKELANV